MKLKNLFLGSLASLMVLVACENENQNLGAPDISISESEMTFEIAGGEQELTVYATRDWKVETDAEWVVVSPEEGSASSDNQKVTVTALENTDMDRTADLKFTIGMKSKYLTVSQAGPKGSAEAMIVYSNDLDKTKAEKASSGWNTYLDSFDGWLNAEGTGVESVTYAFDRITVRTNSGNGSAGKYSDYVELGASGMNYFWFGSGSPYFAIKNITLPEGKTDYTLSFGTEKYEYQAPDNTFDWDEFKVYVSADGAKWVELAFDFAAGVLPNGRWDLAKSTFTVPSTTTSLYVYMAASVGSAYAVDDIKLELSATAGTAIDFAAGEEFEVGDNTTGGGSSDTPPVSAGKKTVQEFIEAADTDNYYELTGTVSGFNSTYCSFDLTDETGEIYVYSVLDSSKSEWASKISNGGTITIYGKYLFYENKSQHEVVDAYIVSFTAGEGGEDGGSTEAPAELKEATVAEFIAASEDDTWYKLTGEIVSIASETYGNFTVKDETGEVYVYGMTNGWVGSNDKSFASIGLEVGDIVTFGTLRTSYDNSPQGGGKEYPAYYISHVEGEAPEVTPTEGKYVLVSEAQTDWTGKYLVVFGTSAHASLTNKDLNATVKNLEIVNGEIAANTAVDAAAITVAANGDAYSALLPSGKYFGMQKNGCKNFDEPFDLSFEYTADGVKVSGYVEAEADTFILYNNSNNGSFYRCYVEKNGQAGYTLPALYKYVAE